MVEKNGIIFNISERIIVRQPDENFVSFLLLQKLKKLNKQMQAAQDLINKGEYVPLSLTPSTIS